MGLEYRNWETVRQTYLCGKSQPVWLAWELVKRLGHVPRAAKRLKWTHRQVREAVDHAEWNAVAMAREREEALAAGFRSDVLMNSPHGLVFPAKELEGKPVVRRRRRCWRCR